MLPPLQSRQFQYLFLYLPIYVYVYPSRCLSIYLSNYQFYYQIFSPTLFFSPSGQSNTGSSAKDVVLTTPCETTPEFERDLIAAARSGGFNVLRLLKEPVAAVMAYGLGVEEVSFYMIVGTTVLL